MARTMVHNSFLRLTSDMTYRDLKKAVISRGMPFKDVINGSFFNLNNWLNSNYDNKIDKGLLNKFDDWLEDSLLEKKGNEILIHPTLRLSYVGDRGPEPKKEKTDKPKKPKRKREKTSDGIFKGTKKALTYKYAKRGYEVNRVVTKVKRKYSDASEKSIKIWYKKAMKLYEKEGKGN